MDVDAEARAAFPATHTAALFRRGLAVEIKVGRRRMPLPSPSVNPPQGGRLEATLEARCQRPRGRGRAPDWTPDADWTDKTQYYPTVLAPEPSVRARRRRGASRRARHAEAAADEYLVVQLPSRLPLASNRGRGGEDALVTENRDPPEGPTDDPKRGGRAPNRKSIRRRALRGADPISTFPSTARTRVGGGRLGDLEVLADGSARLVIGDASFDVVEGTPFAHVEQLACVDAGGGPDAKCAFLGRVPGRLVCIPDVAELLRVKRE